ncbi:5'-3' exonuclease [Teredinibacter purpureus]|uniref:5'-3' exonuclease n=1 Tax=Teredinibacter purpureus TaxID=2731756 RepID=UPI0005F7E0E3|nr:5'-3' exonuclease H3TH domain-containing protein [Teredinibacter purpureus]
MKSNTSPVLLIDASIYIFKYYFSMPDNWWSEDGSPTGAVYGYSYWLLRLLEANSPSKMAACFDESLGSCFRNTLYPNYKCSRALPDELLAFQLKACQRVTELLGIPSYVSSTHEADDLLATLASRCRAQSLSVGVVTRDKDLAQLVLGKSDFMWDAPEGDRLYASDIIETLGVAPAQVADYLALVGDASDDIPGVPGVGAKTASALLRHYPSWHDIKQHMAHVAQLPIRGAATLAHKLVEYESQVDMAIQLTRVVTNAPLGRRFSLSVSKPKKKALQQFGETMGFGPQFNSSINRVFPTL